MGEARPLFQFSLASLNSPAALCKTEWDSLTGMDENESDNRTGAGERYLSDTHSAAEGRSVPARLLEAFRRPAIVSRWLLVLAETVETVVVLSWEQPGATALFFLTLLFLYNVASLIVVHVVPLRRLPIAFFMVVDMMWLLFASAVTGMSGSPFIGQFFLIIFASSLFFGASGGVLTGVASALATGILALSSHPQRIEDLQVHAPYFLICGAFSGYLVDRLNATLIENEQAKAARREIMLQAEATRHEMELARVMQEAALPASPLLRPGIEIGTEWEFAREVGGDFHGFFTNDRHAGIVIGDVSGKGVPAALAATTIGHLLSWLNPLQDTRKALRNLNLDLVRRLPRDAFVTLQIAIIDPISGVLQLWNAGHPPALLCRGAARQSHPLEHFSPLLGVFAHWDGCPLVVRMQPGDVFVLYTDGLLEARNDSLQMFGRDNIARVVEKHCDRSASDIASALRAAVDEWATVTDDLTIVVCKFVGITADSESQHSH